MNLLTKLSAVLAFCVTACAGDGGEVTPTQPSADRGWVALVLATPNANDGALLISVSGGAVLGVTESNYDILSSASGPSGVKLLVRGHIVAGPIATIELPDRKRLPHYRVTVEQAAARSTYQQQNTSAYGVTVSRR
jgi:hypothetical protein